MGEKAEVKIGGYSINYHDPEYLLAPRLDAGIVIETKARSTTNFSSKGTLYLERYKKTITKQSFNDYAPEATTSIGYEAGSKALGSVGGAIDSYGDVSVSVDRRVGAANIGVTVSTNGSVKGKASVSEAEVGLKASIQGEVEVTALVSKDDRKIGLYASINELENVANIPNNIIEFGKFGLDFFPGLVQVTNSHITDSIMRGVSPYSTYTGSAERQTKRLKHVEVSDSQSIGTNGAASASEQHKNAAQSKASGSTFGDQDAGGRANAGSPIQSGGQGGATRAGDRGDGTRGPSGSSGGDRGDTNPGYEGGGGLSVGDSSTYDGRGGSTGSSTIGDPERGTCFVAGTLITLSDGLQKPIEQIELKDKVLAFDGMGALEPREVIDLMVHDDQQVLNVDGVLVTPNHPFLLPDGSFKAIGDLSVGDVIVRADGSPHVIEAISAAESRHTVYNFTVSDLHTYVAAGFRVHNKHAAPVMLDLDGDGLEVTALDRSTVFLDTGGDGFLHRTAWAGEGDGVLYFDPDGRNEITEKRQFVFTEWDPTATSDLEALASVFDTNGDGILSAGDSAFARFKVMVTLADGSTVSRTLTELGITEIDLTADASNIELSDGSVITGKTTFTRADGSTGTVGDMLLASERQGHRVIQEETVDGAGTRSLTTTAYAADGSKAYQIFSELSSDGLSVTNRYDDDGDGVIDRIQIIETVVAGDGRRTEMERNFSGADETTAVLTSQTQTEKLVNPASGVIDAGSTEIISRDSAGGGWFDQRETRSTSNGSLTILVENLAKDGSVITSRSETVSADGATRIDGIDADGDRSADTTETHNVVTHADDSRTETITITNQDGSLRSKVVEEVGANNRSKVITRDLDGDGLIDQREILDISATPLGGSTSRLDIRNGDGSLKSASVTVTSNDALTRTTELDRDGDGDIDLTTVDATTVNADGSRVRLVTERNADGSIRSMRKESLDADKVGQEIWADLNQNGSFEADELVSSVVANASTLERTATEWTRSADGSVLAEVTGTTSADGLTTRTESDLDGDGDIDLRVSDVTVQAGTGSATRTVITKNGDNSLRTKTVTETSADGLTRTVREDVDGDSVFEKITVNTLERDADGGTTQTASAYAGNGTSLLSRIITTESADRRTTTITTDRDGDGAIDSTVLRVKGTDGAVTQTVTETADGTLLGKTVTTTSANGLETTISRDLDGDGVTDVTSDRATVLNEDGSRTTVQKTENGDGSLRSASVVTLSDDGLKTVTRTDADGNGTYERVVTDETVLEADGSTTRTVETRSQSGQLLSRSRSETSDDGLVTVQKTDRDGNGSYDLVETATTVLKADGDTVTTTDVREGGVLRSSSTRTVSDTGRSDITETDINGDGKTDLKISQTIAGTGVVTAHSQSFDTSGTLQSQTRTVTSANGLTVTVSEDADGNNAYETRSETVRVLKTDGSVTTTTSHKAQNNTLLSRTEETVSDDGLSTTLKRDLDGDKTYDTTLVRGSSLAPDGTLTTLETVTAADGSRLSGRVEIVDGDGRSSTVRIDANGDTFDDEVVSTGIAKDGSSVTTAFYYSESRELIARTITQESGNGLKTTISFDLDGNEATDRTLTDETKFAADGTTIRTVTHETGAGRLLAREEVTRSDDGLTVTTALDLDGQGGNDFVTTRTTGFGHDGSTRETWQTFGPGGEKGSATRETSGDGLVVTTQTDLDGDGDTDRSTSVVLGATGGRTETSSLYGAGSDLLRSETTVVTANERQSTTTLDQDGDAKTDIRTQSNIDLSGNQTTTWTDYAANGTTAEAIITREASANGTSDIYRLDIDGDSHTDITRETRISYDSAGNEIRVFEEKNGSAGVLGFKSTTVTSANGLTSTTQTDSDGDGEIDTRAETRTVYKADGSTVTTSRDWYVDSGEQRSSYLETVSADGRAITEMFDFDGDSVTDKSRVTQTAADGSVVVVETGYGEGGVQKREVTTTSSDGLTTTVLRDGVTQTFSRSPVDNGSYVWDNGKSGADHITVAHKVDAMGIETWEMTSAAGSHSQRFDAAAKALLLAEAARLYDAVFDRDMDASEIEVLVKHAAHGRLDLEDLASELLGSTEYSARYGTLSDVGFVARAYQNTFGREPSLEELSEHLAALKAGTSKAALIAELSESAEHIVVGNGHGKTNNYDVFLIDAVREEDHHASFGVSGLDLNTSEDSALVGTAASQTLSIGSHDAVLGLAGNDTLNGSSGDDLLVGGTGNDTLNGGTGNDTYLYNRGDGTDTISDYGSGSTGDTLRFGEGIEIEDLHLTRVGDNLKISFHGESAAEQAEAAAKGLAALTGAITLTGWWNSGDRRIERLSFDNGDSYWIGHISSVQSEPGVNINMWRHRGDGNDTFTADPGSDVILGAGGNDTLHGSDGHDVLLGGEGTDNVYGGGGNDVLDGGASVSGWQYLNGYTGNDTYIVSREDYQNFVNTHAEKDGWGTDTIVFDDLTLNDLEISIRDNADGYQNGDELQFVWRDSSGRYEGALRVAFGGQFVERFEFADGTSLSSLFALTDGTNRVSLTGTSGGDLIVGTEVTNLIYAGDGDDTLDAGGYSTSWQHLRGQKGDDTYLIGRDDGEVWITQNGEWADSGTDTVRFKDLSLSDLGVSTYSHASYGEALMLTWDKDGHQGKLFLSDMGDYIERFEFADGTSLSSLFALTDGTNRVSLTGTSGGDLIVGTEVTNLIYAGDGDDTLDAGGYSTSWQHLRGQKGDDTYLIGRDDGEVWITQNGEWADSGTDTVRFKDLSLSDLGVSTYSHASYGEALMLTWDKDEHQGKLFLSDMGDYIERFEFADGTSLSSLFALTDGTNRVSLTGTSGGDLIVGTEVTNLIYAGDGDDTLDAGGYSTSWQHLRGQKGDDTYLIGRDDGEVWITQNGEWADSGTDTVRFKDLSLSDLGVSTYSHASYGEALMLTWDKDGHQGKLFLSDMGDHIERFEFADGTSLSSLFALTDGTNRVSLTGTSGGDLIVGTEVTNLIYAGDGDDTLDAGGYSTSWQHLRGQKGDDTYLIGRDDGEVWITQNGEWADSGTDTVRFKDLSLSDLGVSTYSHASYGEALMLTWDKDEHQGKLFLSDMGDYIERFEFADGTSLSSLFALTDGTNRVSLTGTSGGDLIVGTEVTNLIYAGDGDDTLDAGGYSTSWQHLRGQKGDDTYLIGRDDGEVWITQNGEWADSGTDTVRFKDLSLSDLGVSTYSHASYGEALMLTWDKDEHQGKLFLSDMGDYIERFEFADGTSLSSLFALTDGTNRVSLTGTSGGDLIVGTEVTNLIYAGDGDDTLDAGGYSTSWQHLRGQKGDDTYLIGRDDGEVWITQNGEWADSGTDTVRFKDLSLSDLGVSTYSHASYGEALMLTWDKDGHQGKLFLSDMGDYIERFEFADGTTLSHIDVDAWSYGRDVLYGTSGDDYIVGSSETNIILGGAGNDTLSGGGFDDAWQYLRGQSGDDTYLYDQNSGRVVLDRVAESATEGNDRFIFNDLVLSDLTITVDPTRISGNGGNVLRLEWSKNGKSGYAEFADEGQNIETFEFADGTTLSRIDVDAWSYGRDVLYGTSGDDYIVGSSETNIILGGAGNDTLSGGGFDDAWQYLRGQSGDDTYLYDQNSGRVVLDRVAESATEGNDRFIFNDLVLSDLTITVDPTRISGNGGNVLRLEWSKNGKSGYAEFADEGQNIETFEFADGTTLSRIDVDAWSYGRDVLYGTSGDDYIVGSSETNIILGGAGNDTLSGGGFDDAWQYLRGQSGDDTYLYDQNSGRVVLDRVAESATEGNDRFIFNDLVLSDLTMTVDPTRISGNGGNVLRLEWSKNGKSGYAEFADEAQHFERFEFADDTSLSSINLQSNGSTELLGTTGNDRIAGTMGTDHLTGGAGSDIFVFTDGHGNDTITDFTDGSDLIQIEGGAFSFADLVLEASGADALVRFGSSVITLDGVQVSVLGQDDFLFA